MRSAELALRKELALAHVRIARAELELARAKRGESLAVISAAVDLASTVLAQPGLGPWSRYGRLALHSAHLVLGLTRAI
jgi:hypothetical protein